MELMSKFMPYKEKPIHPGMTVLDIISKYRKTEAVFKQYDQQAGECICCQALFEPLSIVATKYGLDLRTLLKELETAANI
jgi:hypothetical protein